MATALAIVIAGVGCTPKKAVSDHPFTVTQEHRDRAAALVEQMTLEEKCAYIGGSKDGFYIRPVERLGIPLIRMADGPQGVRNNTKSTLFACGVAAAAAWNEDVVYEMGVALGQDSRARGVHILLGPGVNIYRSPLCGRNFEYMGEDPLLAAKTSSQYIKGVQSQGVMASVKHFALNNQETDRHHISSDADERTINEIYFPAFKAAVDAGVATVMSSYNLVNNVHAAENEWLLKETLKGRWGFEGFVMSDWTSTYSTLGCVRSGLDLEMPQGFCMNYENIKPLIDNGVVREADIDDKVQTILENLIAYGFLDRPQLDTTIKEDHPYSREVAYRLSCESAVLLKNEGALPLAKGSNVVLMGPRADVIPCGGGSGAVDPLYSISLYEGMKSLGEDFPVTLVDDTYKSQAQALKDASAVVVSVGFDRHTEKEDHDRTFALPQGQEEYLRKVLALNENVVVVLNAGGGIDMASWLPDVKAVLMAWYPGQQGGLAVSEIITGKVSPSGRLPISIEKNFSDNPVSESYYENVDRIRTKNINPYSRVEYREGLFVGYRGYEAQNKAPLFPFGYGLSYSEFEYSDLKITPSETGCVVTLNVKNVGRMTASETVQVYVGDQECSLVRPKKELKGFEKVSLAPGQTKTVTVTLGENAFRFYDPVMHQWQIEPGLFNIYVGSSSADIRLTGEYNL